MLKLSEALTDNREITSNLALIQSLKLQANKALKTATIRMKQQEPPKCLNLNYTLLH